MFLLLAAPAALHFPRFVPWRRLRRRRFTLFLFATCFYFPPVVYFLQSPPGENGSGRGPDAGHTIDFKETDAHRTRAWPFLPGP
eukprot:gene17053-biopygen20335